MTYAAYNPDRSPRPAVSREEWLKARKSLLEHEKELTRLRDKISAERRKLPWVKVEKNYVFDAPEGKVTLAELFDGRSQLAVYHFMLTPGKDHVCPGCSFIADHIDAARQHFEHADLSFAAISRAPLSQIMPVKKRMGWDFRWVSSNGNDFNYDYGVSFRPTSSSRTAAAAYNYRKLDSDRLTDAARHQHLRQERRGRGVPHLLHLFARRRNPARRVQLARSHAEGPQRRPHMNWVRLHDEYEDRPAPAASCCA